MSAYPTRKIGDIDVSAIGFGAMGLSTFYGKVDSDEERFKILDAAYESGCTFWDTSDFYGDSEDLFNKWFKKTGKRNDIFLATKFGFVGMKPGERIINGEPAYVKAACEKSLSRLGVDSIDLYYLHRVDETVPIEHTVAAMAELVREGKVKYIGLSECSADTLRRASKVHPIAALQTEYSPFTLDIEDEKIGVLKTCRDLGIKLVAYSPLGRGLITGQYKSLEDFEADDMRRWIPRYNNDNFPNILKIADGLKAIGARHGATAGQVALAWLLAQGDDIIPIPGTKKVKYLKENIDAVKVKLTSEEVEEVRNVAVTAEATGVPRYPPGMEQMMFGDTPKL